VFRTNGFEHFETINFRHLNIKEYSVWSGAGDSPNGLFTPTALADDLNIRLRFEERSDSFSRPRLVVDYQYSHVHRRSVPHPLQIVPKHSYGT